MGNIYGIKANTSSQNSKQQLSKGKTKAKTEKKKKKKKKEKESGNEREKERKKRKNKKKRQKRKERHAKNIPEYRKRKFSTQEKPKLEDNKEESQEMKRKRNNTNSGNDEQAKKAPKRKVAVMFGYRGTGYHGLQIQYGELVNLKTIELDLVNAFAKIGAISEQNKNDIKKVGWSRAGRTDKGVHAARQYVVFKMLMIDTEEKIVELVNKELPEYIRVWGIQKVPKKFCAQRRCNYREYQFLLPTFLLTEKNYPTEESKVLKEEKRILFKNFTEEALNFYNEQILSQFIGTNNYHNYTKGIRYNQEKAKRYIIKMVANKPITLNGQKWILIEITGQAFLIHQIRKMITMSVAVMRGCITLEQFQDSFTESKYSLSIIPGIGLLLDRVVYESYNTSESAQEKGTIHFNHMNQKIDTFKMKHIFSHVAQIEQNEHSFYNWLKLFYKYPIQKI
ncbi:tRNA pseudouridine synthase a [Anaeramoeba flamelloides]|uniref:tRNA pseudouridine synthase a n=1 Tax=Anaeramoeba flamelloides TaxID=1746091 RepID=A0AAV8A6C9_9EUKA|nr:tRNA pseudouridine synthase a [Anaeramoeba flamelloides]